jgi:hypothetical protein
VLWLQGVFLANQLTATGTDGPFGLKVLLLMQAVFRILDGGITIACLHDTPTQLGVRLNMSASVS